MTKPYEIIYLDMDGVLVNFLKAAAKLMRKHTDPEFMARADVWEQIGCEEPDFWGKVDHEGIPFWSEMEKTENCDLILDWAHANAKEVAICTAPPRRCSDDGWYYACAGKARWLKQNGLAKHQLMLTRKKGLVAKPGVLLVDDLPHNIEGFLAAGGEALLLDRGWNKEAKLERLFI